MYSKKNRLIKALHGVEVDRPPFICPGGMLNMVTTEMLNKMGIAWTEIYGNTKNLTETALRVSEMSGIENLGVPFCMTVEAEALGAKIETGSLYSEPRIASYPLDDISGWHDMKDFDINSGRMAIIRGAVRELAAAGTGLPVIVSLTGPVSLATSLLEPMTFFRAMHNNSTEAHALLGFLTENIIRFAGALAEAGADILTIADPSSGGEIMGPAGFSGFALPYINRILQETESVYSATMVHICGRLNSIFPQLNDLYTQSISIDSATSTEAIRNAVPGKVIAGNISTHLLQAGSAEQVKKSARYCLSHGIKILAPACGLSMRTPIRNLKAVAEVASEWKIL